MSRSPSHPANREEAGVSWVERLTPVLLLMLIAGVGAYLFLL